MTLSKWERRSSEEANLFNPAFCAALAYENINAYVGQVSGGAPLPLVLTSLVATLHRRTRSALPQSIARSFYGWIQENEHLRVGFDTRIINFRPRFQECIMFGLQAGVIEFDATFNLKPGEHKGNFTPKHYNQSTPEMQDIIDRVRFLGRWYARSGETISILTAWGVRP